MNVIYLFGCCYTCSDRESGYELWLKCIVCRLSNGIDLYEMDSLAEILVIEFYIKL